MRHSWFRGVTVMAVLVLGAIQSGCAGPSDAQLEKMAENAAEKIVKQLRDGDKILFTGLISDITMKVDPAKHSDAFNKFLRLLAAELEALAGKEENKDIEGALRALAEQLKNYAAQN